MSYPTTGWTLDDLLNAARELAQYDSNGELVMPGLSVYGSVPALLRSLYGRISSTKAAALASQTLPSKIC